MIIDGHDVSISNPDKVLFPDRGHTKLDLVRYYLAVADGALRAAGGRPNMLVRYPNGVDADQYATSTAAADNRIDVIDFKTDVPPDGPVERAYPEYVVQLRTYGRMVEAAGIAGGRRLRCGLLFTADGAIRWVDA